MASAERRAGLDSHSLVLDDNNFGFPCDEQLKISNRLSTFRERKQLVNEIRDKYDILHFNFGTSLIDFRRFGMNLLDLTRYRGHCKIVVSFNGSDLRNWDHQIVNQFSPYRPTFSATGYAKDRLKRLRAKKWMKHASHAFVSTPDLLQFLPSKKTTYLPGIKENIRKIVSVPYDSQADPFRIVHAPSNRSLKGTQLLIDAVAELQHRGVRVELTLVEGITNSEALKLYKSAHLIVDQLLIGWYGAFAIESMALGKPVMVYINKDTTSRACLKMQKDVRNTFVLTTPNSVQEDLMSVISNRAALETKAKEGPKYVNSWHSPDDAIKSVIEVYRSLLQ